MASVITNEKRALEILEELDNRPAKNDVLRTQCMFETCMKIKNDESGEWESAPENFNWETDKNEFSHGVCPECYPAWFTGLVGNR